MITAAPGAASPLQLRDSQQQQGEADQLEDQRPGLVHPLAAGSLIGYGGGRPEAQGRDNLFALAPVEQVKRRNQPSDRAEEREKFAGSKVQKKHSPLTAAHYGCHRT